MHPPYLVIQKNRGETPLGAIEKWKSANPEYASLPVSYAGRLDPMAEGKLLVLLGDECRKQKKYTKLDKEYEIEVVLDLSTDTGDVLGLPSYAARETSPDKTTLSVALTDVTGTHQVPYPAFSSKTIQGKPLFLYALESRLDSIQIPEHDETIYRVNALSIARLSRAELQEQIESGLVVVPRSTEPSKVLGADFRQDVIRAGWRALFEHMPSREFTVLNLRVACATGTYMRSLAERIGKEFGTTALALSIKRTKIGTYKKLGPFRVWIKTY